MKRLFCLMLVLCLLLTGCGKKEAEVPTEPATQPATEATEATEAPTTEATEPPTEETEPETEPTEPPIPTNPLTGEELEAEYTGRPVAFSLNNAPACLPQYGLDDVDWLFEIETEGGVTRCMGIMTDPSKADVVGPIRSCRTYFLNLSVSYHAPLFHCGGSNYADLNYYNFSSNLPSWDHVNEKGSGKYFYRDSRGGGYATEHTLFTNGERMATAMEELGYAATSGEVVDYGYQFADTVALDGAAANSVTITFRGSKTTTMNYNSETGLYEAYQRGGDWIDGSTGEVATFRNVLIVLSPQSKQDILSFYALDGTGDGYFAVDGKMVPVKWQHSDASGPFSFTLEDGTPITLGVGKTFCAIIDSNSGSVEAE